MVVEIFPFHLKKAFVLLLCFCFFFFTWTLFFSDFSDGHKWTRTNRMGPMDWTDPDSCASPSDNFISLRYLMPTFSTNLFGLFSVLIFVLLCIPISIVEKCFKKTNCIVEAHLCSNAYIPCLFVIIYVCFVQK